VSLDTLDDKKISCLFQDLKNDPELPSPWPSHITALFVLGSCVITILDVKQKVQSYS